MTPLLPSLDLLFRSSGPDGMSGGDASIQPDRAFWRYYFAGQALAGCLATDNTLGRDADLAVKAADALLAALEAEERGDG